MNGKSSGLIFPGMASITVISPEQIPSKGATAAFLRYALRRPKSMWPFLNPLVNVFSVSISQRSRVISPGVKCSRPTTGSPALFLIVALYSRATSPSFTLAIFIPPVLALQSMRRSVLSYWCFAIPSRQHIPLRKAQAPR